MEAGLGGGSSDAAAALLALNRLWGLGLSLEELQRIGFSLGADVPFCLVGGTALVQGLGERITPLPPFPPVPLALVKPPFGLATARVYASLPLNRLGERPDFAALTAAVRTGRPLEAFPQMINVLEAGTGDRKRDIQAIKEELAAAGARRALMSGSGSAVFGFFLQKEEALAAAFRFRDRGLWAETAQVSPAGVEVRELQEGDGEP
jgi:4-diphosphocytidyl-2-C-methyl-D-erythritol kinase